MKRFTITILTLLVLLTSNQDLSAQAKIVTETVKLKNETTLDLVFTFANMITFKTWDKQEVKVDVSVDIQDGKYNDIFTLTSKRIGSTVQIAMDKNMWKKIYKEDRKCGTKSNIDYVVYLPKGLEVISNTISGNYELVYFDSPLKLKTISGEIDLTVPKGAALDFWSKTITGEIYSDLEITYPEGKKGLNQIVGQKIKGRIKDGGIESAFESISGNIYLRKG